MSRNDNGHLSPYPLGVLIQVFGFLPVLVEAVLYYESIIIAYSVYI